MRCSFARGGKHLFGDRIIWLHHLEANVPGPNRQPLKSPGPATDNPFVDELTREFLIESQEGLDRMERCLTELAERPGDHELLAEIFRSVHTIKGTTGFLG